MSASDTSAQSVLVVGTSELTDAIAERFQEVARAELGERRGDDVDVLVIDLSDAAGDDPLSQVADAAAWCESMGRRMCARRDGAIVVIGTTDAYASQAGGATRATLQGGALGLVRGYGIEFAPFNVRVVGVAYSRAAADGERLPPIGRHPTPAEVANTVEFMAGPDASYVVAETIRVDGGFVAYQMF
jgi:Enoyl-(Acyl carrier protein) reductase